MVDGFAARAFDFETACADGQEFGAVLTLAPIFVTLLHFFFFFPAVSDKIRPPVQVTALKLTQAISAWLARPVLVTPPRRRLKSSICQLAHGNIGKCVAHMPIVGCQIHILGREPDNGHYAPSAGEILNARHHIGR